MFTTNGYKLHIEFLAWLESVRMLLIFSCQVLVSVNLLICISGLPNNLRCAKINLHLVVFGCWKLIFQVNRQLFPNLDFLRATKWQTKSYSTCYSIWTLNIFTSETSFNQKHLITFINYEVFWRLITCVYSSANSLKNEKLVSNWIKHRNVMSFVLKNKIQSHISDET